MKNASQFLSTMSKEKLNRLIFVVYIHILKLSTLKFLDTNDRRQTLVLERVNVYAICKGFRARLKGLFGPVMLLYMSLDALRSIWKDNIVGNHYLNSMVWKKKMEFETAEFFFAPVGRMMKAMTASLIVLHKSYGVINTIRVWIMMPSIVNSKNIIQVW